MKKKRQRLKRVRKAIDLLNEISIESWEGGISHIYVEKSDHNIKTINRICSLLSLDRFNILRCMYEYEYQPEGNSLSLINLDFLLGSINTGKNKAICVSDKDGFSLVSRKPVSFFD